MLSGLILLINFIIRVACLNPSKLDVCNFKDEVEINTKDLFVPPPSLFFVMYAPDFSELSGGATVLHRFCDLMNTVFDDKRVTPLCFFLFPGAFESPSLVIGTNPAYKTPMLPKYYDSKNAIVIYPEVIFGNPISASRIVRYILYFPGTRCHMYY